MEIFFKYSISTKSPDESKEKQKTILIFCEKIKEIIPKRTLLVNQSIEIFKEDGKSYFFNFFRINEIEKVYNYLEEINTNLFKNKLKKIFFYYK